MMIKAKKKDNYYCFTIELNNPTTNEFPLYNILLEAKFNKKEAFKIGLGFEEIVTNIIKHSNYSGEIRLSFYYKKKEFFMIEIIDDGDFFDPTNFLFPQNLLNQNPLNEKENHGFGIFIIKKYSDKMEYERKGDFNILKLFFKIATPIDFELLKSKIKEKLREANFYEK